VVARELVPELMLVSPAGGQRLLPDEAEGDIEVYAGNDGFEAYGYAAGRYYWAHLPGTASFRFDADGSSVVAFPDDDVVPSLIEDAYYRNILPLVLQLRGHEVLHASAVRTKDGVLVFCGVSGTGKSTLAYRFSHRGYAVWADDALVLGLEDEAAVALHVPFRLGLPPSALTTGPHAADHEPAAGEPAPILGFLILGQRNRPGGPLVDVRRLQPIDAFTALVPHAYCFRLSDSDRKALMLDRYLRLASSVPTFEVHYAAGIDHIEGVLDELEDRALRELV
jgi:hypothetical protein